jgi:hypothetical protein
MIVSRRIVWKFLFRPPCIFYTPLKSNYAPQNCEILWTILAVSANRGARLVTFFAVSANRGAPLGTIFAVSINHGALICIWNWNPAQYLSFTFKLHHQTTKRAPRSKSVFQHFGSLKSTLEGLLTPGKRIEAQTKGNVRFNFSFKAVILA